MPIKATVKEMRKIRSNINPFVETIYKNFKHLSGAKQLGHNREEIKRLLTNNDMYSLFVFNSEGLIIAYLVGEFKTLNDGRYVYYISYLFVAPKYRKKGIGMQLMKYLIDKCEYMGIKYILLTCDTHKKKVYNFYQKLRFMPDPLLRNFGRHEILTLYL